MLSEGVDHGNVNNSRLLFDLKVFSDFCQKHTMLDFMTEYLDHVTVYIYLMTHLLHAVTVSF